MSDLKLWSDAMIDALDAGYGVNWSLWRAAAGHWCVRVGDQDRDTLIGNTLSDALNAAVNHRVLPVIPRRPLVPARAGFQIKASGGWYEIHHEGQFYHRERLKKSAVTALDKMLERARESQEAWDIDHAHFVATHVEGVDFVYSH